MPLRPALCFLCLPHREVWQFFQQLHNQVLLHILINGQLVDHGGVVFDHLFFGPFLAGDGGTEKELRKIAARIAADSGVEVMFFL